MNREEQISRLREAIEEAIGKQIETYKDFDQLSDRIFARVGDMLSRNTLRRIWGKINDATEPRSTTLSILARFIGYNNFEQFCTDNKEGEPDSSPIFARKLSVVDGLMPGDRIRLTWRPNSVCDIEYNGSLHFRVIHSEKTRLKPGDTFLCSLIVENHPLFLDQLEQKGKPVSVYSCGKKKGVRFERL